MSAGAWLLLGIAGLFAIGDWVAVVREDKRLEYVCKPLTIVFLMGVLGSLDVVDGPARNWFLLALFLSGVGDVFLMLPSDRFVFGLVSFLLGHLAYIAGMWTAGVSPLAFVVGLAVAALSIAFIGARILAAVRAGRDPAMVAPVAVYMTVISLMLASAIGSELGLAVAGAALFYVSDATIAWQRFVRPRPWHPLAIIVTYHLAQAGLALSLVR